MAQRYGSGPSATVGGEMAASSSSVRDRSHDVDEADNNDLDAVRHHVAAAALAREQV